MVYAVNNSGINRITRRCRNNDFLGTGINMCLRLFFAGKEACALKHYVNAKLTPRQVGRVAFSKYFNAVAIDYQLISLDRDVKAEHAMGGVILSQMCIGIGITQIINGHDLKLVGTITLVQCTQDVSTDTSVTIYRDFYCHYCLLLIVLPQGKLLPYK